MTGVQWETINCPICSSRNYSPWRKVYDRFETAPGTMFTIVCCEDCGFRFLNPRPDESSISRFYSHPEYDPFQSTKDNVSVGDLVYRVVRAVSLRIKRNLVHSFQSEGSLLDVGCGTGEFLTTMRDNGWYITGIEPDDSARHYIEQCGIPVFDSLGSYPESSHHVITLWHAIEHLHRLEDDVNRLTDLLKPGGILVLAMPNVDSWDFHRYQEDWVALDTPRHLYHFTEIDVIKLTGSRGLRLLDTRSLWLDTIYNVLYSELLRKNRSNLRLRPFYMINSLIGSYIHDRQTPERRASASVYIFCREGNHA